MALFLAISITSDIGRAPFLALRSGFSKPYVGLGFLWWLPEPALVLAIPSCLFGAVFGWRTGFMAWTASFLGVAISYPTLRGAALIHAYWAFFGATYLVASAAVMWRSLFRKISKEESLLLLFSLMGLGDLALVHLFGLENYWGVLVQNTGSYALTLAVVLHEIWKDLRTPIKKLSVESGHEPD